MALTIPHNSQAGIAVAGGGRAAPYVSESAFMTPGQRAMPEALNRFAAGLDKAGGAVNAVLLDRQRMQNATDLQNRQNEEKDAFRAFDAEYKKNNQGVLARDATAAYEEYFKGRYQSLQKEWGSHPYLMRAVDLMFSPIRQSGLSGAAAYSERQEKLYLKATSEKTLGEAELDYADIDKTDEELAASLANYEASLRMLHGQRFDEKNGGWTGGIPEAVETDLVQAKERLGAVRRESITERDSATVQSSPAYAESLPLALKDAPKEYQDYFTPVKYDAHRAKLIRNAKDHYSKQAMRARELMRNHESYLEYALEKGDFGPLELELDAVVAAGPDHALQARSIARDIETFKIIQPLSKLSSSRPFLEQIHDVDDYLESRKTPEDAAYLNDVKQAAWRSYGNQVKAIAADPAGFVAAEINEFKAFSGEDRTAVSLQRQADLYAGTGITPAVLTRERRDYIQQQWASDSYHDKAGVIAQVRQEYGVYAAQAMEEAKIPDAVVAAAPALSAFDPLVQSRWMAAASVKQGEIQSTPEARKLAREEVSGSSIIQALNSAFSSTHNSQAQFELLTGMQSTLENYVMLGGKLSDIENSFAVINDSGATIVMPASEYVPGFEAQLETARAAWLASPPESIEGLPEPERTQMLSLWRSQIANGNFVYSLADGGAVLCDEATGRAVAGVQPVRPRATTFEDRIRGTSRRMGEAVSGRAGIRGGRE